ncbi:TetR family transcriptional regulator [Amycolatopsis sp. WAC 01375]|uniref:TetR/AcrR family transcriptional regulator n=1 Tax=unclassified Amycolatopsis TaxID=2618356 RepID=UPI000F78C4F3|nr:MULTISPECIES: TetR/AcrR family transcriptional regulator [unclassified Amycolatopsis]RSM72055.1 TetR family transcriptional regulator [Amycolatopsis sp. WAC 01375]RSN32147.1 TetR family transcriptional regulator [Amycolatopsis sp. WAC 01416]
MAKPLRKDAQRNRDLLVQAARGLYAVRGLDVPLEEIAKTAGVSIGTLYNHFPQRADLVNAVFADRAATVAKLAGHALSLDDAWAGLTYFAERICELQAADRGYNELASTRPPQTEDPEHGYELMTRIVERAKESGDLRADFTLEDMAFVTWGIARTVEATAAVRPEAWRRHLALLLDGMRATAASPLPEPPLLPGELARLMGHCD